MEFGFFYLLFSHFSVVVWMWELKFISLSFPYFSVCMWWSNFSGYCFLTFLSLSICGVQNFSCFCSCLYVQFEFSRVSCPHFAVIVCIRRFNFSSLCFFTFPFKFVCEIQISLFFFLLLFLCGTEISHTVLSLFLLLVVHGSGMPQTILIS